MREPAANPYVVGQWVRAEKFYGRAKQLAEVLSGPRDAVWILGTRRIGKTSLLKQLEWLAESNPELGFVPIYWDFQGADSSEELHLTFHEALLDCEDQLAECSVRTDDLVAGDLFGSLRLLRRRIGKQGRRILLLCDEVEELIGLHEADPSLLSKLRRVLQSSGELRVVLASTVRLWALSEQRDDTSPFLHGFAPPVYLASMDGNEALSLVRQDHLPHGSQPGIADDVAAEVAESCGHHPYLMQLVGKRYLDTGDLDDALEVVASDGMVSHFFTTDYEMLTPGEQDLLRRVADIEGPLGNPSDHSSKLDRSSDLGSLVRLESLGFLRQTPDRGFTVSGLFYRQWLRAIQPGMDSRHGTRPNDHATGDLVDARYELRKLIGEGGTGLVYLAFDRLLQIQLAVKLLRPEYCSSEEILERFRREIVLSRDLGHPNILRTYHLGEADGQWYLTMQWVDGPTLAQTIARKRRLGDAQTISIARRLASALEAAHAHKVLHRDIKSQNILLDDQGVPYMMDFGLARQVGAPLVTEAGMFLGTPCYVSPEQASMEPVDERSDLYSLGVVLFEMATGSVPFEAESIAGVLEMHRTCAPPDPREREPDVGAGLAGVTLRCLAKRADDRFASAADLGRALDGLS